MDTPSMILILTNLKINEISGHFDCIFRVINPVATRLNPIVKTFFAIFVTWWA